MSKERQSIQVTIRLRPLSEKDLSEDTRLCLKTDHETRSITMLNANDCKKFIFDQICENDTQEDVFEKVGKKSTIDCIQGYNCTVFAYGQTGAGKTYTMMGINYENEESYQLRGLIPRTLQYLFQCIDEDIYKNRTQYLIRCYFLEIYNEQIIDLLNKSNSNLQLREDIKKGVYVEGIEEQTITRPEQAMEILKKGSKGRHVGSTFYNEASSRSHSVFTMLIQSRENKSNGVTNTKSRHFHFIDLAGSERTKQSMGQRLKEGCSINKSLHVLGNVINSLADYTEGKTKHVNYRDSKLTFLLKDSLGGNSKTHLIANIHIGIQAYHETMSTLSFARRVKLIKLNKVSINEDSSGNIQALKGEIKRLKDQIIRIRQVNLPLQNQPMDSNNQSQINPCVTTILHQYVSQELEKQTKLQFQISKLHARINHLQEGIKYYAQNQSHLRMIISIYDDKFARNKHIEEELKQKIDKQSLENQQTQKIAQYFKQQRQNLIKQVNLLKQMGIQNGGVVRLIKSALRDGKLEGQEDELLVQAINKNSQLLGEIKKYIGDQFETNPNQINIQIKEKQFETQKIQLEEKVQQLTLQLGELRNQNQENQVLLKESIDTQITIEKDMQVLKILNEEKEIIKDELIKKLETLQQTLRQNQAKYEALIQKTKNDIERLSQQKTQYLQQNNNLKMTMQAIQISKQQVESQNKQHQAQILTLKTQMTQDLVEKERNQLQICQMRETLSLKIKQNEAFKNDINNSLQQISNLEKKNVQMQSIWKENKQSLQSILIIKQQQFKIVTQQLKAQLIQKTQQSKIQITNQKNKLASMEINLNDALADSEKLRETNEKLHNILQQTKQQYNVQIIQLKESFLMQKTDLTNINTSLQQKMIVMQSKLQQGQALYQKTKENYQFKLKTIIQQHFLHIKNIEMTNSQEKIEFSKQLEEIQKQMNSKNMKNSAMDAEIKQLKIKNQQISLQYLQSTQLCAQYQLKIKQISENLSKQQLKLKQVTQKNTLQKSQKDEKMQKIEQILNQKLAQKDVQIKELSIKLQDALNNYVLLQKRFTQKSQELKLSQNQLLNRIQESKQLLEQLSLSNKNLQRDISQQKKEMKEEKAKLTSQLSIKSQRILQLEQSLKQINRERQHEKQRFQNVNQTMESNYQTIIADLKNEVQQKETLLKKAHEDYLQSTKIQTLKNQQNIQRLSEQHKQQILLFETKTASLNSEILSIRQSYQSNLQQLSRLNVQNQEYMTQIKSIEELLSEKTKQNQTKIKECDQLKCQNHRLSERLQQVQRQRCNFEENLHKAEVTLRQIKNQQSKSNEHLTDVISDKKDTEQQMNKMRIKFDEKSKQLQDSVKQEMKKAQQIEQKYLTEIMQKSSLINDMRTSLIETQEGQKRYEQTIKSLRSDLNSCQEKFEQELKELTNSLVSKEEELRTFKKQLSKERQLHLHTQLQLESYDNLQQIKTTLQFQVQHTKRLNIQLNSTNAAQNTKITQLRQYSHKLESEAQESKQIIENFKFLISNSENQKQQLEVELAEKDSIYKRLVEKIANTEEKGAPTSSQHYLKTVQLLEKSRHQLVESRKQNEEQKKTLKNSSKNSKRRNNKYHQQFLSHRTTVGTNKLNQNLYKTTI